MSNQAQLRMLADAAQSQLDVGPREWPGSPSRQRLEFFLSASPGVILGLLDELEDLRSRLWKTYVNGVGKHDSAINQRH